ncbi:MAG: type II toxin-antitoxin system RelE/ParE family toxin [Cyanobacteriota bacterium]
MSRICRFTVFASRDLENILNYLAEKSSISSAESFLEKFNQKCQNLANFPSLARSRFNLQFCF